jgi:hypothetical protein
MSYKPEVHKSIIHLITEYGPQPLEDIHSYLEENYSDMKRDDVAEILNALVLSGKISKDTDRNYNITQSSFSVQNSNPNPFAVDGINNSIKELKLSKELKINLKTMLKKVINENYGCDIRWNKKGLKLRCDSVHHYCAQFICKENFIEINTIVPETDPVFKDIKDKWKYQKIAKNNEFKTSFRVDCQNDFVFAFKLVNRAFSISPYCFK